MIESFAKYIKRLEASNETDENYIFEYTEKIRGRNERIENFKKNIKEINKRIEDGRLWNGETSSKKTLYFGENEFEDGNHFYRFLEHEPFIPRYVNLMHELQRVDIWTLSDSERLAFFLNLHNAMVIHAIISIGHPGDA
nr:glutaredoxin-related protein [Tanacetum cinerariifolium]